MASFPGIQPETHCADLALTGAVCPTEQAIFGIAPVGEAGAVDEGVAASAHRARLRSIAESAVADGRTAGEAAARSQVESRVAVRAGDGVR